MNATMPRVARPGFAAVLFDIPFPVSIPNGAYLAFDPEKSVACVEVAVREGTRAFFRNRPIVGPTSFEALREAARAQDRPREGRSYLAVARLRDGREKSTLNVHTGEDGGYAECKYFSQISVTVLVDDLSQVAQENYALTRSCQVLNPFLDKYRLMNEDYRISRVSSERNFYFASCHTSPLTEDEIALTPQELFARLETPRTFLTELGRGASNILRTNSFELLGPREPLSGDALEVFSSFVKDEYQMPLSYDLIMQALNCLQKSKEYRLAIVHAETAFEVFVANKLIDLMMNSGISRGEAEQVLENDQAYWGVKRKIRQLDSWTQGNCTQNALPFVPFVASNTFTRWESDLYDKRNAAVHQGESSFKYNDASAAIGVAKECIVLLDARIPAMADRVKLHPSMAGFRENAGEVAF